MTKYAKLPKEISFHLIVKLKSLLALSLISSSFKFKLYL